MILDKIGLTVFLMAVVTAFCRLVPALVIRGKDLPPLMLTFLKFAPVAILTAMLGPGMLLINGELNLSLENPFFWISLLCFAVMIRSRSIPATVLLGIALLAFWRWFTGY